MKKKLWKYIFMIIYVVLIFLMFPNAEFLPVENMAIEIASGFDVEETDGEIIKKINRTVFEIDNKGKSKGYNFLGEGYSFGEVRESRQLKVDRDILNGLEKTYIISEEQGKLGIHGIVDIIFRNYMVNDNGVVVVCKGNAYDIMKYKVKDYPSASDYIYSLVQNMDQFNFWSKDYSIEMVYNTLDAEGKNLVVPYVNFDDEGIKVIGTAVFKGEKLSAVLNIEDSRTMNMLREKNTRGFFYIINKNDIRIVYEGKVHKKVTCKKVNGKYNFTISLKLNGDIIDNNMYKNISNDPKVIKAFEKAVEKGTEESCMKFIKKMQSIYKVDMLNLGSVACAKYGRRSGADWNKIICDSEIKVKVKVQVDKQGRGEY